MTVKTPLLPVPSSGRPLKTVLQINKALAAQEDVYCELVDGSIERICASKRQRGIFKVQLSRDEYWVVNPKRIWAAKGAEAGERKPSAEQSSEKMQIRIERTPVGDRTLADLQEHFFQEPMWLEAPLGSWVILPQLGARRLVFKQWQEERATYRERTLAELIVLLREQEWSNRLLNPEKETPLRSWFIATPVIASEALS